MDIGQGTPERHVSLQDSIIAFLRGRSDGVASGEIAECFLRLKAPTQKTAVIAVTALLASDRRCFSDEQGLWRAREQASNNQTTVRLQELPWLAVYGLTDPAGQRILYCALWKLSSLPTCLSSGWLIDPRVLSYEEQEALLCGADADFTSDAVSALLDAVVGASETRIPIVMSSKVRIGIVAACAAQGKVFTDDAVVARELLKAAEIPAPRSLTLGALEKAVLGGEQSGAGARKQGERFAVVCEELLRMAARKGIESREALDACNREGKAMLFSGKKFSYDDLLSLPARPGVYGFQAHDGAYLYIGKANNLKRRLLSYFTDTEESPGKIERIRAQAQKLVTHECGSELECLVNEYRLIRKYSPPLNKKNSIDERKGAFLPVHDCIVLLPHAAPGKGMSVWFRENQKIALKSFDADFGIVGGPLPAEINTFFFSPKLPAAPSDFPEQEIAVRWIKLHADSLTVVPVSRMACAEEIVDALRIAWRELCEQRAAAIRNKNIKAA